MAITRGLSPHFAGSGAGENAAQRSARVACRLVLDVAAALEGRCVRALAEATGAGRAPERDATSAVVDLACAEDGSAAA